MERLPGKELLIPAALSTLRNQSVREHNNTVCVMETILFPAYRQSWISLKRTEDGFEAVGVIPELYIESKFENKLNFIVEGKGAVLGS